METEPETLTLWYRMTKSLESCIKYRSRLKEIVSDINVTEIFIKSDGKEDEDAIVFWAQLIAERGRRGVMEAYFQGTFKKGYDKIKKKLVQQIPLSKETIVTAEFIEYISEIIKKNDCVRLVKLGLKNLKTTRLRTPSWRRCDVRHDARVCGVGHGRAGGDAARAG